MTHALTWCASAVSQTSAVSLVVRELWVVHFDLWVRSKQIDDDFYASVDAARMLENGRRLRCRWPPIAECRSGVILSEISRCLLKHKDKYTPHDNNSVHGVPRYSRMPRLSYIT